MRSSNSLSDIIGELLHLSSCPASALPRSTSASHSYYSALSSTYRPMTMAIGRQLEMA